MHRDEPADDAARALNAASHDRDGLRLELARLLDLAVLAVPTCIGVSLIVGAPAMTLSALRPGWHGARVRASLSVRLPRPLSEPTPDTPAELRLYAGGRDAFLDTAPSVLALLDMASAQITVDGHLEGPDLAGEERVRQQWLDEQAVIGRAIGVLLDRGMLPADGLVELDRLAASNGTSRSAAARAVIASANDVD